METIIIGKEKVKGIIFMVAFIFIGMVIWSQCIGGSVVNMEVQVSGLENRIDKLERNMLEATRMDEKIKGIIADQLGVRLDKVVPEARLSEDLGADSLDQVELIMRLEEAFGIEIPDNEAEKLTTVNDIILYIIAKTA